MKILINDNDGFKTFLEKTELSKPEGYTQIEFLTVWDGAKYPKGEQTKYKIVLSGEELTKLKKFL